MKSQPPLLRSRTHQKIFNIKLDGYAPRDWDYQNPRHQIRPEFVLGRYKKKTFFPVNKDYPQPDKVYSPLNYGYRRELQPAIFKRYLLSQAATVPGAVIVEESKIKDDKSQQDHKLELQKKYSDFMNKLMNGDLNVDFLYEPKKNGKKSRFVRSWTTENFKVLNEKDNKFKRDDKGKKDEKVNNIQVNKVETKKDKNEEKVDKIKVNLRKNSPFRNRSKRNKKLGNLKSM